MKCVAQDHGLPGVQTLALVGTSDKSGSPTLSCNRLPTWYREDPGVALRAAQDCDSCPFLHEEAELGRPASWQRKLGIIRDEKDFLFPQPEDASGPEGKSSEARSREVDARYGSDAGPQVSKVQATVSLLTAVSRLPATFPTFHHPSWLQEEQVSSPLRL